MCSFGFIPPLTYSGSKKDSFYNLIKPSVAPVAPVGDRSSSQTRCLLFHFHVMPARQMTNTGTNLSLWNTIQTPSLLFFLDHKCNMKVPVLIRKSCDLSPPPWPHEGRGAPWNESQGRIFRKEMQRSPCAADCRLPLYGTRAAEEPRQPPVGSPRRICYRQLDNDIWTFCFFAPLRGKNLDLFGDHRGFDACYVIGRCSALPLLCPCAYYRFH